MNTRQLAIVAAHQTNTCANPSPDGRACSCSTEVRDAGRPLTAHLEGILPKPSNGNLYGTCAQCGATCVRVFLAERDAEEGFCADCIVNVL